MNRIYTVANFDYFSFYHLPQFMRFKIYKK